ncbi:hypothetical protein P2318_03115 [Myxococcaceae bacterium GXIMD 01537]
MPSDSRCPSLRTFARLSSAAGLLALAACGDTAAVDPPGGEQPPADPCAPHGHIHREAEGDWCHCNRGYLAASTGLACEPDPNYTPGQGFSFGDNGAHACWHVSNGPFGAATASTAPPPPVDAFHTYYTLTLRPEGSQYTGTFSYRAFATGNFVVYLTHDVPVRLNEGALLVEPRATAPVSAPSCQGDLKHMVGYELTDRVAYTLTIGPASVPQVGLVVEHLE